MDVEKIYRKSFLRLPEDKIERENQIAKFEAVVESVDKIMKLDTSDMEEYEITSTINSPLREDIVEESVDRELIFDNTIHREYGYFKLDNILED